MGSRSANRKTISIDEYDRLVKKNNAYVKPNRLVGFGFVRGKKKDCFASRGMPESRYALRARGQAII